ALRYLIWIAAFASILFASHSGVVALQSEPGNGGGGGAYGTWGPVWRQKGNSLLHDLRQLL
ncbi:MAG: hypothetical protein ACP5ON_09720, partial [Bacteroidota bacterium]